MAKKKFTHVIITDETGKPMAWDEIGKQLAFCTNNDWIDEHHPVTAYTINKADKLIYKSNLGKPLQERMKYKTMPFEYPIRKRYFWNNIKFNQVKRK